MSALKFLTLTATGVRTLVSAIVASAGAADANKVVATNASGVLADSIINAATTGASKTLKTLADGTIDASVLPSGVGADTATIVASEALAAGDVVNIWSNTGVANVRKADATTAGKRAHGFVLAAVALNGSATVYFEGRNTQVTGKTPGATQFLSTTPGLTTETAPSAAGNVVQDLGEAYSATAINFEAQAPITLA